MPDSAFDLAAVSKGRRQDLCHLSAKLMLTLLRENSHDFSYHWKHKLFITEVIPFKKTWDDILEVPQKLKIVIKYSFQTFHKEDDCLTLLISAEYPLDKWITPLQYSGLGSLWTEEPGVAIVHGLAELDSQPGN